jgi:predicted MFS family arabinose efflux permease
MCITFFPPKALEIGLSNSAIGATIGFTGVGTIVSSFFYDFCIQKFKRRTILVLEKLRSVNFCSFFRFLFFCQAFLKICLFSFLIGSASRFLIGLSRIGVSNLCIGTTSIIFAGQKRASRIGFLLSSYAFGVLVGPFIGTYFYTDFDTPLPFFSIGVVLCGNMLTSIWFIPAPKSGKRKGTNSAIIFNPQYHNLDLPLHWFLCKSLHVERYRHLHDRSLRNRLHRRHQEVHFCSHRKLFCRFVLSSIT